MPRNGLDAAIERRRREREVGGERLIDLRLDFRLGDELLFSVGGRWDRRLEGYDDSESQTAIVVRLHEGQRRAVEWFRDWCDAHETRRTEPPPFDASAGSDLDSLLAELDTAPEHAYAALFAGGRRAGKTWIAVALAVAYAVRFPGAIVWLTSPADTKHDEIRRYVAGVLAGEWIDRETTADGWWLCNGSALLLKTAFNPEGLKEGKAHLVVLNEGQQMQQRAYTIARGAIVDASGCVIVCANPPVEAKDQQWVTDFAAEAAAGRRASVYLAFNSLLNPHIDRVALLAMAAELDERTAAIEIHGEFRGPKDAVAYNWVRLENEIRAPASGDCTEELMRVLEEGDGIRQVVGLDVQRVPHIGGPIYRFFGDPTYDRVQAWIVGEVVLEGGDEVDFCAAMADAGLDPAETLIVCDASGRWQHSRRRNMDSPPPEWHGRGSFDMIRGQGYWRIVPPSRREKKNPAVIDRARAFQSMICSAIGGRRLFADPDAAPKTCKAIREWRTVHGVPSRTDDHAHLGDATSYVMVRLFPRILRSARTSDNPRAMDQVAQKLDKVHAIPASPAELRITPPRSGPTNARRGIRGWGM